jgi:hypothetical protein
MALEYAAPICFTLLSNLFDQVAYFAEATVNQLQTIDDNHTISDLDVRPGIFTSTAPGRNRKPGNNVACRG